MTKIFCSVNSPKPSLAWSFLVIACCCLLSCNSGGASTVAPGESVPDIEMHDFSGGTHSLSEYQGSVVLVNFWNAHCVPCLEEMPALERLSQSYKTRGLSVIGIGVEDTPEALSVAAKKFGVTFPIYTDPTGVIARRFGITGFPETFFVNPVGQFILFIDAPSNEPMVRLLGSRDWDSPTLRGRIEKLLNDSDNLSSRTASNK